MSKTVIRVPEGGAIEDSAALGAEEYSRIMKEKLWDEYERFSRFALAATCLPPGARILEIGPGPGWIGVIIAKARPDLRLEAVEASADMVRAYRGTIASEGLEGRIEVGQGCAERLGDAVTGPFDLVYSRDSLHHWSDPVAAFRSIAAVLAPSGAVAIMDERRDIGVAAKLVVSALCAFSLGEMGKHWRSSIAAGYTAGEVRIFLSEAGFEDVSVAPGFLGLTAVAKRWRSPA
jgi:SAM-dependent methyltransferase